MNTHLPASHTTDGTLTIEWAPFTLAEGVDHAALLAASDALQTEFLSKQPGFIKRELLKQSETRWVDVVYWNSRDEAEQAARDVLNSPAGSTYFSLMVAADNDDSDAGVLHLQRVKTY
jgi:hypothetical protein